MRRYVAPMIILQLDDFEYHVELSSSLNGEEANVLVFCPMFVFLVDWAFKNNLLSDSFVGSGNFILQYRKLVTGEYSFSNFVTETLEGKLFESHFKDEAKVFIKDYIEFDGFINDLTKVFSTNLGALPKSFENSEALYKAINLSRKNYEINQLNFSNLVVFSNPEELINQQKGVG